MSSAYLLLKPRTEAEARADIADAEPCFEHDRAPCAKCLSDLAWLQLLHDAEDCEYSAAVIAEIVLNNPEDQAHVAAFEAYLRGRAYEIRGRLQWIADQEAREIEDAGLR